MTDNFFLSEGGGFVGYVIFDGFLICAYTVAF